jgi:hypothetical protein
VRELLPYAVDVRAKAAETEARKDEDIDSPQRSPEELFSEFLEERGKHNEDLIRMFKELLGSQMEASS